MAAQRIRAANSGGLPRCKSEGTLIDLGEGFAETSLCDVKGAEGAGGDPHGMGGDGAPSSVRVHPLSPGVQEGFG